MIKTIKKIRKKIFKPVFEVLASASRKIAYLLHKHLHSIDWSIDCPEYYNHDCDLYYQWHKYCKSDWLERGVYNVLALQVFEKPVLIELCCGEGFNTKYFYSYHADSIYACDFCGKAIKAAKKKSQMNNIDFEIADIRYNIPDRVNNQNPTNIIWDAAIEHFSPEDIDIIMKRIHEVLLPSNGILSGYTITRNEKGKYLEEHEYEFVDMDDLKRFFTPYFKNVVVFETIYRDRTNLYFWASDGILPFSENWKHISHT